MSLEITDENAGDVLVVSPAGRIDSRTAADFEAHVIGAIEGGALHLLFDFGRVNYISSAGLRVLLMAAKRLKGKSGKYAICAMSDPIRQVFEIGGFAKVVPIKGNRDEALSAW